MATLVIVRHGQSQANLDNIFTGWTDVPLTAHGLKQGVAVGQLLAGKRIDFADVHTSLMKRAIITANVILEQLHQDYLPIHKTWRLNERHYGALSGQNKETVRQRYGTAQWKKWRRGFTAVPPVLTTRQHDRRYDRLGVRVPLSESLQMTQQRLLPYWEDAIAPRLLDNKNQLVVAHGSSLRALIKYLDHIDDDQIDQVEVPNGEPIIYHFDDHLNVIDKQVLAKEEH
ncbi:2,3-diphosphoglycerate-dependent phosphoglycerate mutase [uncultured Limosilactobacillus sp.]|uniref:2,3-bisphosphoglycerate-dependent phosphoglycerate mutase n=1 Tax=uncultured Limosilactobacillus sp. TaxID=2837629 RepID=UPI0025F2917D|nr:2,3-diphosphoglycerate-dependent phosphoglycerate mutase [uncultured Limosilactobacillus sp.]